MNAVETLRAILRDEGESLVGKIDAFFADAYVSRLYITDLRNKVGRFNDAPAQIAQFFKEEYRRGEDYRLLDAMRSWVSEQWRGALRVEGDFRFAGLFICRNTNPA